MMHTDHNTALLITSASESLKKRDIPGGVYHSPKQIKIRTGLLVRLRAEHFLEPEMGEIPDDLRSALHILLDDV